MPRDNAALQRIAAEFNAEINAAYGLYLDAISGFSALAHLITKTQQQTGTTDDSVFLYGSADAPLHQSTPGILKERIQVEGPHYFHLGRFLIVMLFELWEAGYRERLAIAADVPRDDVLEPIFGDLRRLRNAILHNKGRLTSQLEVLTALATGLVDYNHTEIKQVVGSVKAGLDRLVTGWTGDDPGYRKPFVSPTR